MISRNSGPSRRRKRFRAILGHTVYSYNVLVVPPTLPVYSIADLVSMLKANPGKHTFFSGGPGTPAHVVGELFEIETGMDALHVPFTNAPQGIGNLIAGQLDYGFITTAPMVPLISIVTSFMRGLPGRRPRRTTPARDNRSPTNCHPDPVMRTNGCHIPRRWA